jgi:hypothetical protein
MPDFFRAFSSAVAAIGRRREEEMTGPLNGTIPKLAKTALPIPPCKKEEREIRI